MKFPFLSILLSVLMTVSLLAEGSVEVPTTWPGVKLVVFDIKRLDDNHVLMVIRLKSDGAATEPVMIGDLPKEAKPGPAKTQKGALNDDEKLPRPFSLTSARMVDETTRLEFAALPSLPPKPYLGPNAMITTLGPGGWIQMAVCFKAPPPLPVGEDGKRPAQKVTVLFPRAAKALPGLHLPPAAEEAAAAKP
jgi:hypothetical protein